MSHFKERTEKDCLNCGAQVAGRFCQVCGQENVETKETFWHLVSHFINDITHYDGKFFSTIKVLLLKPGVLTEEYARGRRAAYLHPIRMYVFTSFFFFLVFFSFFSKKTRTAAPVEALRSELASKQTGLLHLQEIKEKTRDSAIVSAADIAMNKYTDRIKVLTDSIATYGEKRKAKKDDGDTLVLLRDSSTVGRDLLSEIEDSVQVQRNVKKIPKPVSDDFLDFELYKDVDTYLAIQEELPKEKRDDLMTRSLRAELLKFHEKQKGDSKMTREKISDKFKHSFPTLLFISLPIFAWILKLLYIRRRNFYYADHGIFSIHAYCGIFLLLLLFYTLEAAHKWLKWWIFPVMSFVLGVYMVYFVYKAMRNFYAQSRKKTFAKFLVLGIATTFLMGVLMLIFLVISAYKA